MGWETRDRGGWYYTRSKWVNGRVAREYVGAGALGKVIALDDELKRRQKEDEAARWREVRGHIEQSAGFLRELEGASEILVRAEFLMSGCHKRRGEWRRLRESA